MKYESSSELKLLFNLTVDAVYSLKSLNSPVDYWDDILDPLFVQRLDQKSLMAWEDFVEKSMQSSKFTELVQFLPKRLLKLESVHGDDNDDSSTETTSNKTNTK